ncbi:unnamed protein product [Angiostrongylus costaricensis]|uniref:Proteasome subunit beta type-4 n=1 Tax=Angiostrongylus costaricensis TaxID=334426 RepID=A0A158PJU7_ANGCS|nr:unnamed protein product [Angiostrongylus costaricensis]
MDERRILENNISLYGAALFTVISQIRKFDSENILGVSDGIVRPEVVLGSYGTYTYGIYGMINGVELLDYQPCFAGSTNENQDGQKYYNIEDIVNSDMDTVVDITDKERPTAFNVIVREFLGSDDKGLKASDIPQLACVVLERGPRSWKLYKKQVLPIRNNGIMSSTFDPLLYLSK